LLVESNGEAGTTVARLECIGILNKIFSRRAIVGRSSRLTPSSARKTGESIAQSWRR
jgi:hypothetical protein